MGSLRHSTAADIYLDMEYQLPNIKGKMVEIGQKWVNQFIARHPEIESNIEKSSDNQGSLATDPAISKEDLNPLYNMGCKYHIKPENTWNTNKKGFAMGLGGVGYNSMPCWERESKDYARWKALLGHCC